MKLWKDIKNLFWPKKRVRRRRSLAAIEASARKGHVIHGEEFERLVGRARRSDIFHDIAATNRVNARLRGGR